MRHTATQRATRTTRESWFRPEGTDICVRQLSKSLNLSRAKDATALNQHEAA